MGAVECRQTSQFHLRIVKGSCTRVTLARRQFPVICLIGLAFAAGGCGGGDSADSTSSSKQASADSETAGWAAHWKKLCQYGPKCADFKTPSGRISCFFSGPDPPNATPYVECDGVGLNPEPRKPCDLDWAGVGMGLSGESGPSCRGDVTPAMVDRHAPVLGYGRIFRHFGFTCLSQRTGVVCINQSGHGFFYAQERWALL
jgi:hypothetical protein